jgi:transglutaminase-like putative cysteine protease
MYLPGARWIAFDPTHRSKGSANLIPVTADRSNKQIMPVVGGFIGAADDFWPWMSSQCDQSCRHQWDP